jgi:hypothetical protein
MEALLPNPERIMALRCSLVERGDVIAFRAVDHSEELGNGSVALLRGPLRGRVATMQVVGATHQPDATERRTRRHGSSG